jgi:hypothetical protein
LTKLVELLFVEGDFTWQQGKFLDIEKATSFAKTAASADLCYELLVYDKNKPPRNR